jgi:hypothetical protein
MKRVIFTLAFFLCITALQAQPLRIGVAGVTHDHLGGVVSALRGGDVEVVDTINTNNWGLTQA